MISIQTLVLSILNFKNIWKTLKSDPKELKKDFRNSELIFGKKLKKTWKFKGQLQIKIKKLKRENLYNILNNIVKNILKNWKTMQTNLKSINRRMKNQKNRVLSHPRILISKRLIFH